MKILLHAPLHPTIWIYLMKTFPEHEWFIEPKDQFGSPGEDDEAKKEVEYTVIPSKPRKDIDLQIIGLHLNSRRIEETLRTFNQPIIWVQYWKTPSIPNPSRKLYPLVHTMAMNYSDFYKKSYHIYISPHPDMWKEDWKGTNPEVFVPIHKYGKSSLIRRLEEKHIPLKLITGTRNISWFFWKKLFVQSRIYLEEASKPGSTCLEEAMLIGMPVIVQNRGEYSLIVRNGIDGFSTIDNSEKIEIIKQMLDSYDYAKEWGDKAKERAREIFNVEKEKEKWNQVFDEALKEGSFILGKEKFFICPSCEKEIEKVGGNTGMTCPKCEKWISYP